jgi:hypothetical protein
MIECILIASAESMPKIANGRRIYYLSGMFVWLEFNIIQEGYRQKSCSETERKLRGEE